MTSLTRIKLSELKSAIHTLDSFDVVRIILGSVLLMAAGLKAYQLATEPTLEKFLFTSWWFQTTEVEFELIWAIFLLSRLHRRILWLVTLVGFGTFCCIALYKGISGDSSCGCFGRINVNPWYMFIFDLVSFVSLILCRSQTHEYKSTRFLGLSAKMSCLLILFLGLPMGVLTVHYRIVKMAEDGIVRGYGNIVILEPEQWVGKSLPLLKYIDIRNQLTVGKSAIVLYRNDCPDCQDLLSNSERLVSELMARYRVAQVAFIEIPTFPSRSPATLPRSGNVLRGRLDDRNVWFVETPVTLLLEDAKVQKAWKHKGKILSDLVISLGLDSWVMCLSESHRGRSAYLG